MYKKVFTKLTALALMILLCFSSFPAFGIYSPGPIEYELDRSYLLESSNASLQDQTLEFDANGKMKFDLLLPFDAVNIEFTYEKPEQDVKLSVETDEFSYELVLAKDTTSASVNINELIGSHTITFTSDRPVKISGVKFIKIDEKFDPTLNAVTPYTDYEQAVVTLVALKCGVSAVKTRGSLLRWDMENLYLTPKNINGSIYVPVAKFAEAMGYYCEDYQDLSYLYLLGETNAIALIDGKGYYYDVDILEGKRAVELDICYQDGYTWAPVRALSEILGFTVGFREGYVAIGDRLRVKEILEKPKYFSSLKEELEAYRIPEEKSVGKTYHVAQTKKASDANSGTEEFPFLTLAKAAEVAKAGDTVIVHEGTYREVLNPKNSGTLYSPITFCAAEDEEVLISALEPISEFYTYKDDVLCAAVRNDLGFGRNQLFYKGEALVEGRHPNQDTKEGINPYPDYVSPFYATRGNMRITEKGGNIVKSTTDLNQEEENYWRGAEYVTLKGYGWSMVGGEVVSSSYGQLTVKDYEGSFSYNLGLSSSKTFGSILYYENVHDSDFGYLTNHINTVDLPGEWFMKDNVIYMIPPENADIKNDFEIKQRQLVIDLRGKSHIVIKGINTVGGGMTMAGDTSEGCIINGGTHKHIAHHTILLDQSRYAMTTDEPNYSYRSIRAGVAGFFVEGQYNAIINATIDHSSALGICVGGKYNYINNNIVSNTSYSGGYPGGIELRPYVSDYNVATKTLYGGHFVTYNTVYNGGRGVLNQGTNVTGKYIAFTANEIAYNRFFNGALNTRDTGITYEYGNVGGNDIARTRMHHNFVYNPGHVDEDTKNMIMGIYHDGVVANRDTYSNVAYYEYEELPYSENYGIYDGAWASGLTICRVRNNSDIRYLPNGEFDLKKDDFPATRPFLPGCDHGDFARRFMDNYNILINDVKENAPTKHVLDEEQQKQVYTFENVHLGGENSTFIYVYLVGKCNMDDMFNITAKVYDKNGALVAEGTMPNILYRFRFYVRATHECGVAIPAIPEGDYTVEIELYDLFTNVQRIKGVEDARFNNMFRESVILGGTYDEAIDRGGSELDVKPSVKASFDTVATFDNYLASNCWNHTVVFKDREIKEDASLLRISYSTGVSYDNAEVSLYVDSLDSEPIATLTTKDTNWKAQAQYVKLKRELKAGKHTFYFVFEGDGKCTHLYNFSFCNEEWK